MATGMINPIFDADQENIKSQLAYADALRKKSLTTDGDMVSGFYVQKNPWQNFIEGLAGGGVESYQRDKQRGIEANLENQRQGFIDSMPTSGETRELFDPIQQEAGPTLDTTQQFIPKDSRQYAQQMRKWASGAPRGMEGIQSFALQQAMLAPEKQAEAEEVAKNRKMQLLLKAQEAYQLQQDRFLK